MEFTGRIKQVLPIRSGTSQRTGNEWKSLPFIFEYFENPSDRYADSVVLETFDTKVIENLKEGMEVRCGFGHRVRTFQKDGKDMTINELRLYKIESIRKTQQPATVQQQVENNAPQPSPQPQGGQGNGEEDDLPF